MPDSTSPVIAPSSSQESVPSIVSASSVVSMMALQCFAHDVPFSLAVNTGASVSLLSESAFSALQIKLPHVPLTLQSYPVTLSSVQGVTLTVLGTATLSVSFAPKAESFQVNFYVIKEFVMPCDGLLGQDSLISHGVEFF